MNLGKIKVGIIDDHDAVRYGFSGACQEFGFELVASADTVAGAIEQMGQQRLDVAVMDLSLADGSTIQENVSKLVKKKIPVLLFSIADKPNLIREALRAGASAIVAKSESMAELARAIELTSQGIIVNNAATTAAIDADGDFKVAELTPREREVLALYASGMALKQVAYQLGVERSTAKEHIDRVRRKYAKLGRPAGTKIDLLKRAMEDGILSGELL